MGISWWYGLVGMQRPRSYPKSRVAQYAGTPHLAQKAEAAGFDRFLVTEHHFWYDGYLPSLLQVLAGIARHTSRIRIGTGALLLAMHDPLRVAEEAAVVDQLCNGRLDLGIGVGYRPEEFWGLGTDKRSRGARCREGIEFLKRVFTEESCTFEGKYYQYEDIHLAPRSIQRPPPIWYAAGGANATAYEGGRAGLNYWAGPATVERTRELLTIFNQGVSDAGLDPTAVGRCMVRDVVIAETQEEAWHVVQAQVMPMYIEQIIGFGFFLDEQGKPLRSLHPGEPVYEAMQSSIVWGTPAAVARQLEPCIELGFDNVCPRLYGASWDIRRQYESIDLFAEQVMPYFA